MGAKQMLRENSNEGAKRNFVQTFYEYSALNLL